LLDLTLRNIPAAVPRHLIIDSTGLSVVDEGEWVAAKHGGTWHARPEEASSGEAVVVRHARVAVPPTRTAQVSPRGPRPSARHRAITDVESLGPRQWKKASGYHRQARVENAFFRYKPMIGPTSERVLQAGGVSRRVRRVVS
jgi:hypothetical protein